MIKTFRYRLYPNKAQRAVMAEVLELARWLYNYALAYRRKRWNESRKQVSYDDQSAMWRDWRNECPEDNPLQLLNMTAGQQVLRRLDSAYRQFFAGKRGRPRFKGKNFFNSINYKPGDGAALRDGRLYIQSVGLLKVKWHRPLAGGKLKNVILIRKPSGWHVLLQVECPDVEIEPSHNPPVGVDVGIHHALALSDGQVLDSPQYLKKSLKKQRVQRRRIARRKKGSKGRAQAVHHLAKEAEHIANQRRDWWHKVVFWLVKTYGVIALEKLYLAFMLRSQQLARAAHDVALGLFHEILGYKAIEAGVRVVMVDPRNTSQLCARCDELVPKALSVRVHECPHCGFTADRDVNAALNILSRAYR
jgi:putative transposase